MGAQLYRGQTNRQKQPHKPCMYVLNEQVAFAAQQPPQQPQSDAHFHKHKSKNRSHLQLAQHRQQACNRMLITQFTATCTSRIGWNCSRSLRKEKEKKKKEKKSLRITGLGGPLRVGELMQGIAHVHKVLHSRPIHPCTASYAHCVLHCSEQAQAVTKESQRAKRAEP